MSRINDLVIDRVCLSWPAYGQWQAEVSTLSGTVAAGTATLRIADLAFTGGVVPGRSGLDGPEAWRGVIRGGMGWGTELGELHATYGGGPVKLSTVLGHLAADCGETIVQPTDALLGTSFARPVTVAGLPTRGRDVLSLLAARRITGPWRVDADGVTRFGVRAAPTLDPKRYRMGPRNLSMGYRKFYVDSLAGWAPGIIVDGATVARLIITEDAGSLVCETWER